MLPSPIFSFENFRDLAAIVELKRLQKKVTYFCTRPLCVYRKHLAYDEKI